MAKPLRILLALGAYDFRIHRGVVKVAREAGWHLTAPVGYTSRPPWGWAGDGIIAYSGHGSGLEEFLSVAKVPVVDLSWSYPDLTCTRVLTDNEAIGRQAAEHFMSRGFRNFLFYATRPTWHQQEQFDAFSNTLGSKGFMGKQTDYPPRGISWLERREWLYDQIRKNPLPLAILCIQDTAAAGALDLCMQKGLRIPDEVAIMGIGNYPPICETLATPLSSVDNNFFGQGEQSAALLARLMAGETLSLDPYRVPSLGVVVRASTDIYAVAHPKVARAVRYIHEHFADPISVPYIAGVAGLSRPGLNKAFRQHLGRTPGEELRRVRLKEGRRLLLETDLNLEQIANQTGYSSANSFCIVFQRAFGHPPSKLRKDQS